MNYNIILYIMDTSGLIFDNGYYDWQVNRIKFILNKFGNNFFDGKKVLELGCFKGGISLLIYNLIKTTDGSLTSV